MAPNTYCYTFLAYFAATVGAAAINITFSSPEGIINHGDPNLFCTPTSWTDILTFFLGNYVAHAATVPTFHGEQRFGFIQNAITALLFPGFGLFKGVTLIMTFAIFGKTDLDKALRAQALYMVVRTKEWRPLADENIKHSILLRNGSNLSDTAMDPGPRGLHVCVYNTPWMTNIMGLGDENAIHTSADELHGNNELPAGYGYTPAPKEAIVEPLLENQTTCTIFRNYNLLKSLIALGQAIYGITTLYHAPGDQISQYGYVAFGLTVAPYATMSVVNLIAALFYPDYPQTYLVETSILVEARNRGGKFHGVVGRLYEAEATINAWEGNPTYHAVREIAFRQGADKTSTLQVNLTTGMTKSQTRLSEVKTEVKIEVKNVSPVEELSVQESPPSATSGSSNLYETYELLERSTDFRELNNGVLLVPACSPFKDSNATGETTEYFIEEARWDQSTEMWGADFKGFVGSNKLRGWIGILLSILVGGIPFAIIGGFSRYQHGKSTFAQRVWITTWLSVGQGHLIITVALKVFLLWPLTLCIKAIWVHTAFKILIQLLLGSTSVGGFVVVAQMLKAYGTCSTIP